MLWVAALASMAGLVEEVIRLARVEETAGFMGGIVVAYVIYVAATLGIYWSVPASAVPVAILINAVLWTLALQLIRWAPAPVPALALALVPVASAIATRGIFRGRWDPDPPPGNPGPQTVATLLARSKGLGARSGPSGPGR